MIDLVIASVVVGVVLAVFVAGLGVGLWLRADQ
jgi:hypothetical protein